MIDYATYQHIRLLHGERGLSFAQIGRELGIDEETAAKYARAESFKVRSVSQRSSKLDAFKATIRGWLELHAYSSRQIFQRLRAEAGYSGGISIVKEYVRLVRPAVRRPNWPLMVMGPKATASVGIAIGHVRSPMQDIIQAAREAEAAAKKVPEKGALCLRVLKRSGEAVQFSTRFDSQALDVWDELEAYHQQQSGRFIYRYLQKLKPLLAQVQDGRATWEEAWHKGDLSLLDMTEAELAHSLKQPVRAPVG